MSQPSISQVLSAFLENVKKGCPEFGIPPHNAPELLDRWTMNMETQVNVNASLGNRTDIRGVYEDKKNPLTHFWAFRIPKGANTETPTFDDKRMTWPPELFAAGIGCTGWNWMDRTSRWVAFDFDSLVGHAAGVGVSDEELDRVKQAACALPWVEVRRSTGGNGLHLYVELKDIPTETHTVHAALARCVLGMMSSETGFDFASRIDACGGNIWIWHRKMTTENRGLELIKAAESKIGQSDLPTNWRDHVDVVKRKRAKVGVAGVDNEDKFDKLANAQQSIALDKSHHAVIDNLRAMTYACEWVADHNCARIHTKALDELKEVMHIRGVYQTNSAGSDPQTPNAFMFPLMDGGWSVYRFSPGITEALTWEQDGEGWTTCQFNVDADLRMASRAHGGLFDAKKNGFTFPTAADALEALKLLGGKAPVPEKLLERRAMLETAKTGHIILEIEQHKTDDERSAEFRSWQKGKSRWYFTTEVKQSRQEGLQPIDNLARLAKTPERQDAGWLTPNAEGTWDWNSRINVRASLEAAGVGKQHLERLLGEAVNNPWKLVNLPFQPFFPAGRQLNPYAPQYRFAPADTDEPHHPHWDMILGHVFAELDSVLPGDTWACENNIRTGRDWGIMYIACMLREPHRPLPYVAAVSEGGKGQNTGKSAFWMAIRLLLTRGVEQVDRALKGKTEFNGELEGTILGVIEEVDLGKTDQGARAAKLTYEKLKSWVTSPVISIRRMRTDTYQVANTLHFYQCCNELDNVPIADGDTRVVIVTVKPLGDKLIPWMALEQLLIEEAPHFMRTVMDVDLPSIVDRLRMPPIDTPTKRGAVSAAREDLDVLLEQFIAEECVVGKMTPSKRLLDAFKSWMEGKDENIPGVNPQKFLRAIRRLNLKYTNQLGQGKGYVLGLELKGSVS